MEKALIAKPANNGDNNEDIPEIKRTYEVLDKMLHPNSTLRKLLQIQMAGII